MKKFYSFLIATFIIAGVLTAQNCTASFNWTQTQNNVIAFSNTSTPANLSSFWTFGDQQVSYSTNPIHSYANPGTYYVCLTVIDSLIGCQDSYCDTIQVTGTSLPCTAYFTWTQTSGGTIAFNNSSLPSTSGYSFQWSFGDNQTSSAVSPNHTYSNPGTYVVCLTMFNTMNCQSTFCDTIQVTGNPPPCTANFTWVQTTGNTIQFTNTSLPSTAGYNFSWSFGDSQTGFSVNPSHTYTAGGNYTVCVTMFDSTCQSTFCDSIYVNPVNGVQELINASWSLYPNPANDLIMIKTSEGINGMTYRILDIAGREVSGGMLLETRITIAELTSGVYFLNISDESGLSTTQRFVKQ
jgi:PKD repeat protein